MTSSATRTAGCQGAQQARLPQPLQSAAPVPLGECGHCACGLGSSCGSRRAGGSLTIDVVQVQRAAQAPVPGGDQVEDEGDPAPLQLVVVAEQGICKVKAQPHMPARARSPGGRVCGCIGPRDVHLSGPLLRL